MSRKASRWSGRGQGGQALVLIALMAPVLIGFLGLALDYGRLASERRRLQAAADAASLAGVADLPSASTALAQADATVYLGYNSVTVGQNGAGTPTITFSSTNTSNDTITVKVSRTLNLSFLPVLGLATRSVSASATATALQGTLGSCDTSLSGCGPWSVYFEDNNGCTPLQLGDIALFHLNGWADVSGANTCGSNFTAANYKGFNRLDNPVVHLGINTGKGGNACGLEPVGILTTAFANQTLIWLPLLGTGSGGQGADLQLNVIGWIALSLNFNYPSTDTHYPSVAYPHPGGASQSSDYSCSGNTPFFGQIVARTSSLPPGGTIGGPCNGSTLNTCIIKQTLTQ